MNIILITIGLILIGIATIKRLGRIVKSEAKLFDGYTVDEAKIQWVGVIFLVIGFLISF